MRKIIALAIGIVFTLTLFGNPAAAEEHPGNYQRDKDSQYIYEKLTAISSLSSPERVTTLDGVSGAEVRLQHGDTVLSMVIPEGFIWREKDQGGLPYDLDYVFENPEKDTEFRVHRCLDSQENQTLILRKARDKGNRPILFENTVLSDESYLIYSSEVTNWSWGFLMLTEEGYSYRFFYYFPAGQGQNTIPEEATTILSTLRKTEANAAEE